MATEKFKWQGFVSKYAFPETWRSLWQVANSLVPFILGWYLMVRSLEVGYWLTLILAVPTAGFMVRLFIIFHDCCHGSFFKTIRANDRLGLVLGVLVLTPFYQWKHSHAIHHATAGDLDRRGGKRCTVGREHRAFDTALRKSVRGEHQEDGGAKRHCVSVHGVGRRRATDVPARAMYRRT